MFKPCVPCEILPEPSAVVPCWRATQANGVKAAIVSCGDCTMPLLIGGESGHIIDATGKVFPSIGCAQCGWHVWGTLERWLP